MKTFAIGDVHGCFAALLAVRELAQITDEDQVIWLGDYVDRGPDSAKVINYLLELDPEKNIFLKGNHEIMMQDALSSPESLEHWTFAAGAETWESYLNEFGDQGFDTVPDAHRRFLNELRPYFETKTHLFVHASLDSELEPHQQFDDALYWGKFDSIGPHKSGKHVVCGHS